LSDARRELGVEDPDTGRAWPNVVAEEPETTTVEKYIKESPFWVLLEKGRGSFARGVS
jgi:hypothetical protein